jgi:two-component system, LytTR family, sensor kinase
MICCQQIVWPQSKESSDGKFGNYFLFNINVTEKQSMVRQPMYFPISDTAVYRIFDKIGYHHSADLVSASPVSPALLGVKLNSDLQHYFSATVGSLSSEYYSFIIQDSSDAVLIAMGINSSNYKDFRYHVVENDSIELVPWSPVTDLRKDFGAKEAFAFIGKFNKPGKWIVVEVYNVKDYSAREGVIFDWRTDLRPQLEQIIAEVPGNYFNILQPSVNRGYASRFNKVTGAPEDLRIPADSIRNLTFQFRRIATLVSAVHLIKRSGGHADTTKLGVIDRHGYFSLDANLIQQPGNYEIVFQRQSKVPDWNEQQLLRIPFEVTASSSKTIVRNLFISLIIVLFALILTFWIYRRTTKKQLKKLEQQKEIARLKLNSIRSQLNPHFIFNALSSIQNLMNKQAIAEANHYLNRFASLTRAALDSNTQELISLGQEWKITDDYLKMEQLRFGFSYELAMDQSLQPSIVEIPPMLLQPLIENAVKHGIAGKSNGQIRVSAIKSGKDLKLSIKDNGKGFNTDSLHTGLGIRLSRERIELLNNLYHTNTADMVIQSDANGTNIIITLKNWL